MREIAKDSGRKVTQAEASSFAQSRALVLATTPLLFEEMVPMPIIDVDMINKKKEKQILGGIDDYENYFTLGFGMYDIPVANYRIPPSNYC